MTGELFRFSYIVIKNYLQDPFDFCLLVSQHADGPVTPCSFHSLRNVYTFPMLSRLEIYVTLDLLSGN